MHFDAYDLNAAIYDEMFLPDGTPAAFEFRHESWLDDGVHERLRAGNHALVTADTDEAPADEIVARLETQRRVVDAVMALDEPYRTVVVYRYFDDLPPKEIAARLGVPVGTVKTRLKRALKMRSPMPNSSTRTPASLAVTKCPSSWRTTRPRRMPTSSPRRNPR